MTCSLHYLQEELEKLRDRGAQVDVDYLLGRLDLAWHAHHRAAHHKQ